jgi:hypothetical protein
LNEALENELEKKPGLRILAAYINHSKLKNKYKALYELFKAEDYDPNIAEEF